MEKIAIFVSDLHLGRGDELEDFVTENEAAFVKFIKNQSEIHMDKEIDLVLLGDSLDIWQVASDHDKTASDSKAIDVTILVDREIDRVQQIITAHPNTFTVLGQFIKADARKRRVVLVTGNHDHSLVNPNIQSLIQTVIADGNAEITSKLSFPDYYEEADLCVYAEHGNQYDANNCYDDFTAFGQESPGYYFVRLFWNRFELKEPNVEMWMDSFRAIWKHKLWKLLPLAFNLFRQYRNDPRPFKRIDVPGIPIFATDGQIINIPVTGKALPEAPDILLNDSGDPERIFSTDDDTENRLRLLYHDSENIELKKAIDEILNEKYFGQPPAVPSEPVNTVPMFGILQDEYIAAIEGMFSSSGQVPEVMPMCGHALTKNSCRYVLFGHTHERKREKLDDLNVSYLNTGTWSVKRDSDGKNKSSLSYVIIQKKDDGTLEALEANWKLK